MKINLHIERLVLDGLPVSRSEGALVQTEVEAELSRLLGAGGLSPELQSGAAVPSVPAGNIEVNANSKPARLGQQIATAVFGGIGK